jgi:hypothetical protein
VAHEEEGLDAIFDFVVNSDSFMLSVFVKFLYVIAGSCDVIKRPLFLDITA